MEENKTPKLGKYSTYPVKYIKKESNGLGSLREVEYTQLGISQRLFIATQITQGLLHRQPYGERIVVSELVEFAYDIADELLKQENI